MHDDLKFKNAKQSLSVGTQLALSHKIVWHDENIMPARVFTVYNLYYVPIRVISTKKKAPYV